MEAIILAGGLGTRLRDVIGTAPKCMAMVAGEPFLAHLFRFLEAQQVQRIILSLGHGRDAVLNWVDDYAGNIKVDFVVEEEPLGTGGGILLAMSKAQEQQVFVINGDTYFDVSFAAMLKDQMDKGSEATLALKPMQHFDRYGLVKVDAENTIVAFEEKQAREEGLINGGVYCIDREAISKRSFPSKFSFEKEYLEKVVEEKALQGFISEAYFIDIGIPADYVQAQKDFKNGIPK